MNENITKHKITVEDELYIRELIYLISEDQTLSIFDITINQNIDMRYGGILFTGLKNVQVIPQIDRFHVILNFNSMNNISINKCIDEETEVLIEDLHRRLAITSIVVTHDLAVGLKLADRLAFLLGGKVIFEGSKQDLDKSKDGRLWQFLQGTSGGPIKEMEV